LGLLVGKLKRLRLLIFRRSYMIKFLICLFLVVPAYAQNEIPDTSNQSIAVINDENRKTRDELRSIKRDLLGVNAVLINGYNTSTTLGPSKIYVSDGSNYLPMGSSVWMPNNITAFTENGTWIRPANITRVYVKVWGAGGRPSLNAGGGGGGGGGYTEDLKNVSGNIAVIVAGGSHAYRTSFNDTLNATTGTDGSGTAGGAGGQGYGGRINLAGTYGGGGSGDTGYFGGSGGGSPFGGAGGGGGSNTTGAANGCIPGGGAGGGSSSGVGANGTVIVYY
jgi:hypothetical protein